MALRPISRLDDFRFPDGAWDVRGWSVRTQAGEDKVGRVDDILLDQNSRLRYLDVDLGFLKKHILVPLERAFADRDGETVWIEGLTRDELEAVPEYALDPEALDADYERRLDAVYGGTRASSERRLVADEAEAQELDLRRMSTIEDDYQIAGEDPRGWKVVTGDGHTVGRVVELLMEPARMKARFLDVAVDEKGLDLEPVDRHILLPAERVRLDRKKKAVLVSGLLAGDLGEYPQYGGLPLERGVSRTLDEVFERVATADRGAEALDEPGVEAPGLRERSTTTPGWHDRTLHHFYRPTPRGRHRHTAEEE